MNKMINKNLFLVTPNIFFGIGLIIILIYLSPLFLKPLYISIFDILDSTIPMLKILAHSGMIYAPNDAIIPNMMNGLPRSTYGSTFNVMLWLNYFFEPLTAYIINQIVIHLTAYISSYIFLRRYLVKGNDSISLLIALAGSLYYGLLPYFSPEGLSIPLLPLVTYSLLNIKNNQDTKWDWVLLAIIPLYSSFVFVYAFYIMLAGLYLIYDGIRKRQLNLHLFGALFLMGMVFLMVEYRLVYDMLIAHPFISHRIEFNKFFAFDFLESLRRGHSFFLNGHAQHLVDLQMPYVIPLVIIGMLLSLSKKVFTYRESMVIWVLIITSFGLDIWINLLVQIYTIPILTAYALIVWLITKYDRTFPLLFLLQIVLGMFMMLAFCNCANIIIEILPFLKSFNISRIAFIQPLIWLVLIAYAMKIYASRLQYTLWFILLFILVQTFSEFSVKEFYNTKKLNYATFEQYYEPTLFTKIKHTIPKEIATYRIVNFGFEPAVSLYNGFYTVDGYTTNYPLAYKRKFRKVIEKYLNTITEHNNYDEWGSKAYLLGVVSLPDYYKKDIVLERLPFSVKALCTLHTDYLLSAYKIDDEAQNDLSFIKAFKGKEDSWDIYLYKIQCRKRVSQ